VATAGARIVWTNPPAHLAAKVAALGPAFGAALGAVGASVAFAGEARAKADAPWTNQTGAARAGLHGTSAVAGLGLEVVLAHGVDYGVWLELANQGRYGVIPGTLQVMAADLEAQLHGLLANVARGL